MPYTDPPKLLIEVSTKERGFVVRFQDQNDDPSGQPSDGLPLTIYPFDLSCSSFATEFKQKCIADLNGFTSLMTIFHSWRIIFEELPSKWSNAPSDTEKAYLTTLQALIQIFDDELDDYQTRAQLYPEYCKLVHSLFKAEFRSDIDNDITTARFQVYDDKTLEINLVRTVEVKGISFEQWWEAIKNICDDNDSASGASDKNKLESVLRHSVQYAMGLKIRPTREIEAFTSFLKAYCDFAQRRLDAVASLQVSLTQIFTSIVLLEEDPWQERGYITKIFASERNAKRRDGHLKQILQYAADNGHSDSKKSKRLVYTIAEQYLGIYHIEKAIQALQIAPNPEFSLKLLLGAYNHLAISLMILASVIGSVVLASHRWPHATIPVTLALSLLTSIGLLMMILRDHTTPIRLLFPRLFGAITVGVAPLLTNGVTLDWNWANLGLISIAIVALTYLGALVYIYLEVESILKKMPTPTPLDKSLTNKQTIRNTALNLFGIGVAEALIITTVSLALFAPLIDGPHETISVWGLTWPLIKLDLSRIIIWAGVALFLGSFLQLLWQDRRVTAVE